MQKLTIDELGIVVALVIAGILFLSGGSAVLGALLLVAAVVIGVALWTPLRQRLHIPPSPRRTLWRPSTRDKRD
jgi:hypothetical protein